MTLAARLALVLVWLPAFGVGVYSVVVFTAAGWRRYRCAGRWTRGGS